MATRALSPSEQLLLLQEHDNRNVMRQRIEQSFPIEPNRSPVVVELTPVRSRS